MIVAMEARLLPMATWFWSYEASAYRVPPPSPHAMRNRHLQIIVFAGWVIGVPALAAGLFLETAPLVSLGAWSLCVGVAMATLDNVLVIARVNRGDKEPESWLSGLAKDPITASTNRSVS
jgi:hypothetical protein